jgi:DNA recombination protein RmuC
MEIVIGIVVGAIVVGILALVVLRRRSAGSDVTVEALRRLDAEQQKSAEHRDAMERLLGETQHLLAAEQARSATDLGGKKSAIDASLTDVKQEIRGLGEIVQRLDADRKSSEARFHEQVRALSEAQELLRAETGNLATALRSPTTRGRWGEMQLRRVIEMAGMLRHCDFTEQPTVTTDDGRLRPDVVVRLPGKKSVVVDAKVALQAFLEANEATDRDVELLRLEAHARHVRGHVDALASKEYWSQFPEAPDFVVMFVPGDQLLAAALERDPGLMEHAVANRVLLATPVTLIALLRSVAYGWQQAALAENARNIAELGRQLQDRLAKFSAHLAKVGRGLDTAVGAYNEAVGSYESRVVVTARRLGELEVGEQELVAPTPVERRARPIAVDDEEHAGVIPIDLRPEDPPLALEA